MIEHIMWADAYWVACFISEKKKEIVGNHQVRFTVQPSSKQFILL